MGKKDIDPSHIWGSRGSILTHFAGGRTAKLRKGERKNIKRSFLFEGRKETGQVVLAFQERGNHFPHSLKEGEGGKLF